MPIHINVSIRNRFVLLSILADQHPIMVVIDINLNLYSQLSIYLRSIMNYYQYVHVRTARGIEQGRSTSLLHVDLLQSTGPVTCIPVMAKTLRGS